MSTAGASIARANLGREPIPAEYPLDVKLQMYRDLAGEAVDPFRKRGVRDAGADMYRMLDGYRRAVENGSSVAAVENFIDSLAEMGESLAVMMTYQDSTK